MSTFSERDLRRALAPVRPDPAAFRAAVERKLAQRERGGGPEAAADPRRRAAAALPLDLLAPGGASAAALGKQLSAGGVLGALTLPAVSLAMLALAFAAAVRFVVRAGHGSEPAGRAASADEVLRSWWRAHALHAALALALLALLAWTQPAETVLLALLASMAVVAALVSRLARAGAASRASVGALAASFLGGLLGLALVFDGLAASLHSERVPPHWVPTALFWGCLACDVLGRWKRTWSVPRKLAGALAPTALVAVWLVLTARGLEPAGPERLAHYVARPAPALGQVVEWQRLGRVGAWLLERGLPCDRSAARTAVAAAWGRRAPGAPLFDAGFGVFALAGAARLDALPDDLWRAVADDPDTRALLEREGTLVAADLVELRVRALARAGLTDAQRDHLARRLDATWPPPEAPWALENMGVLEALAERIGRPPGEGRDGQVARALELHWLGADPDEPFAAPFASEPWTAGRRRLGDPLYLGATHAALELLRRHGAPPGLDLARVRAFLERAARPSLVEALAPAAWPRLTVQSYRYDAAVALRVLAALPQAPAPERPDWRAERALLAALLLVALCLFATLWAGARRAQRPMAP